MSQSTVDKTLSPAPAEALTALVGRLQPVSTESAGLLSACGRVLAQSLVADRDSPPSSVSAMDGYAMRFEDLNGHDIPVAGTVAIGQAPVELPPGQALRLFTGACVPLGADVVIRREDVQELGTSVRLRAQAGSIEAGDNIRYQGENRKAGQQVMEPGRQIDGPAVSALAAFGMSQVVIYRKVRLGLLITGDELLGVDSSPQPWQLRDSNGPALQGMFANLPWLEVVRTVRVADALPAISNSLAQLLSGCDAIFITGGVSMGDCDYVPAAVQEAGCEVVFHKLPIRPGKPLLAAVAGPNKAVLGLPGNPVSVMVTARRFGLAVLRKLAGFTQAEPSRVLARLKQPGESLARLWWYRPVRLTGSGAAQIIPNMGSGDLAAVACSDGFIEMAPGAEETEVVPFWPWAAG